MKKKIKFLYYLHIFIALKKLKPHFYISIQIMIISSIEKSFKGGRSPPRCTQNIVLKI